PSMFVNLGPHPPRLWPEDVDRAHELWLELTEYAGSKLHHRDVVGVALRRMQDQLRSNGRDEVLRDIMDEVEHHKVPAVIPEEPAVIPGDGSGIPPTAR